MAIKVEDVINFLLNINVVESAAEVTEESWLEVDSNLDDGFYEA